MKKLIISIGILIVAVVLIFTALKTKNDVVDLPEDNDLNGNDVGGIVEYNNLIRVTSPRANQTITSPLFIEGEARGTWYFEASFPVTLLDAQGNVLVQHYADTSFEWMTEEYVPFSAHIEFSAPAGGVGTLILSKSNPSGLSEMDDEVRIPVRFGQPSAQTTSLNIHFSTGGETDCSETATITRTVPRTQAVARAALEELLKGLTQSESEQSGLYHSINPGVRIQSLNVSNGTAKVDFSSELEHLVGGSCRVAAIQAQIRNTLLEFPTVNDVEISIDGRTEDILQP